MDRVVEIFEAMISKIIDYHSIGHLRYLVERARNVVVTCHLSPDGDAIGSSLGLCKLLRNMGKRADVVLPDQVPRQLTFITLEDVQPVTYSVNRIKSQSLLERASLVICLDFNSLKRIDKLGPVVAGVRADKVMIDHHEDPDLEGLKVAISHPEASSTCELVYRVAMQAGWLRYVDRFVARCLYLGMMTDTGNFAYDNADDPEVFEIVAALMRHGIDRHELHKRAIDNYHVSAIRLQGYALHERMRVDMERGAALITLDKEELERFGYQRGDTEALVNRPLSDPSIRWSTFMREDAEHIKVSMRAEGDFRVDEMCARYFHGGGHIHAAGGEFCGTMAEAVAVYEEILAGVAPLATVEENENQSITNEDNKNNED